MKHFGLRRFSIAAVLLGVPVAALADISNTATLSAGQGFSFDSGTVTNSGDIVFTGTSVTFQGGAKGGVIPGFTGASNYGLITQTLLQSLSALASSSPIPASSLSAGAIAGVQTVNGNGAKLLVTAISSSSFSFQFTTFESGTGGGPANPTISSIQNNSSTIPSGFPNGGIAPSTIFVVKGANMATAGTTPVLQNVYPTGTLPSTLNGTTLAVTVNGTTVHPAFWYSSPTQLAAELPANTPAGTGTLTVSFNGASASAPITVVPAAFGIDVYNGNTGVVQDSVTGAIITPTNSAKPGETVTLWGTGLGADTSDSDVSYAGSAHAISTQVQVYLGGVLVPASNIVYAGSLGYPGVNGVIFTVPANAPSGCFVSIAVVTGGNTVSNIPTAAFMPNGGVCTDAYTGLSGTQISTLSGNTTVKSGGVLVGQSTSPGTGGAPTTSDIAVASFSQVTGSSSVTGSGQVSVGSCALNQTVTASGTIPTVTGLDAGTITVTPPGGSAITLQTFPQAAGVYEAQLSSGAIPASGGTFAFNGSGGTAVGPFSTTVNFPNPLLSWTNQSAAATVTRSAGVSFSWTGGAPGSFVIMTGTSSSTATGVSGSYTCIAPVSAGGFTVPPYITLGLPAGTGTTSIENSTGLNSFSATGLDYGYALGFISFAVNTSYQ